MIYKVDGLAVLLSFVCVLTTVKQNSFFMVTHCCHRHNIFSTQLCHYNNIFSRYNDILFL